MKELVELEEKILACKGKALPDALLIQAKKDGFSDRYLSQILGKKEEEIRKQRLAAGTGRSLGCSAGQRCGKRGLLLFHLQCEG